MSFPAHPSYKSSGVRWLGDVPHHWSVVRFKNILHERDERSEDGEEELLSVSAYTGISPRSQIIDDGDHLSRAASLIGYKRCLPNDLVMNIMLAWNRGLGVSQYAGIVSPAYWVFVLSSEVEPRFIDYLCRSNEYTAYFKSFSSGVIDSRLRLYPDTFGSLFCGLPPLNEQLAIAAFLDRETAKIDTLIEEQRRLIALLKEKRQATISQAVTKGIDPQASMKDGGTEWLGEVPTHWERVQLGRVCRQVSDGPHFSPDYVDEGIMFLSARNIRVDRWCLEDAKFVSEEDYKEFCRRVVPEIGDILYTKGGTTGVARVVDISEPFQVWVHVAVLKIDREIADPHFVAYALNSTGCYEQSQLHTRGATNKDLGLTRMIKIWMALPPIDEQRQICEVLTERLDTIDALAREAERAVTLFEERRTALISAAVTGKIDVRSSAQIISFPIDRARTRGLIATEIITRMANRPTFGRVKLQKLVYLAEAHVGVAELGGNYLRMPAGPLDSAMVEEMEREAGRICGAVVEQPAGAGTAVTYRFAGNGAAHKPELEQFLGPERSAKLAGLIKNMEDLDTKAAEAVATLYAVCNDALIDGDSPDDDSIVAAFLNDWHPEKSQKFRPDELHTWLGWMRRHNLMPAGAGPQTYTGRLFV